jgi:serine/threonine protein kinase
MDGRLLAKLDQVHSFLWKDELSETYSCTVPGIRGRVAVKVFSGMTKRGSKEAQALKGLEHPNLVRLLHVISHEPLCLVCELCLGGTLHSLLHGAGSDERAGGLTVGHRLQAVAQVVSAVAYLHEKGVVHSAVRPDNIFLSHPVSRGSEGVVVPPVVLGDLGLSRFLDDENAQSRSLGTLRYMAPEVLLRASYDTASDVFSCSMMMHEVLTGTLPYSELNIASHILVLKVCAGLRPSLDLLRACGAAKSQVASILVTTWEEDLHSRTTSEELKKSLFELIDQRRQSSPEAGPDQHMSR